MKLAEANKRI